MHFYKSNRKYLIIGPERYNYFIPLHQISLNILVVVDDVDDSQKAEIIDKFYLTFRRAAADNGLQNVVYTNYTLDGARLQNPTR